MEPASREAAETAILERFLIEYHKRFDIELSNIIHSDKPDFEVTNPIINEHIGSEVTGTYQNEKCTIK